MPPEVEAAKRLLYDYLIQMGLPVVDGIWLHGNVAIPMPFQHIAMGQPMSNTTSPLPSHPQRPHTSPLPSPSQGSHGSHTTPPQTNNKAKRAAEPASGSGPAAKKIKLGGRVCDLCGLTLKNGKSLYNHQEQPKNCQKCGKEFKTQDAISHHQKRCKKCKNIKNISINVVYGVDHIDMLEKTNLTFPLMLKYVDDMLLVGDK